MHLRLKWTIKARLRYLISVSALGEAPGLVDRVFAVHTGSRGFDSHRREMSDRFFDPIDQNIRTQCALSWKIVVSEWRSLTAVSAILYRQNFTRVCTTQQTRQGRTHGTGCAGPWFRAAGPLRERRYENWITTTTTTTNNLSISLDPWG